MKKQTIALLALFIIFLVLLGVGQYIVKRNEQSSSSENQQTQETTQQVLKELTPQAVQQVSAIVDFGDGTVWKEMVRTDTAYNALVKVADVKKVKVITQQFKYGVIVEKVANIANTPQKGWTFYVNGKLGRISSDRTYVRSGDVVEWKYTDI